MDIRRILFTLRQQVWLLVGIALATLAAFVLLPEWGKKATFVSRAKVLLTPSQRAVGDSMRGGVDQNNWMADQQTLVELLTSERLLTRVAQACNLRTPWQDLRDQVHFEAISQDYTRKVTLFSLTIEDSSPVQSKKLTEVVLQEFMDYIEELSAREFANTRRFLEELVAEAKEKVDDSEEKLLTLTSEHSVTPQGAGAIDPIESLETEKRKLKDEAAELEAEVGAVQSFQSGHFDALPSAVSSQAGTSLSSLQTQVDGSRVKLLELQQVYTDQNVLVVEQKAKLFKLEQLYDTRARRAAESVAHEKGRLLAEKQKQIQSCQAKIAELRHKQLSPAERRQVAKLERQLNMWEENHLNLVKQLYQARVVEQSSRRQGAITILESPGPGMQAKDRKNRSMGSRLALGLPFSVGLAVAAVVGLEFLGASMRLVPKIESSLGIQVLAVIPPIDDVTSEIWEAYKREETLPSNVPSLLRLEPGPGEA